MSPEATPRVRFAPSPTGRLHIGGARTALFNWAYARHTGGTYILRIEDTDPERSTQEFEDSILDSLRWLGLDWDEGPGVDGPHGPYRQSERIEGHRQTALQLLEAELAYPCFCDSGRLAKLREEQMARKETPRYDRTCEGVMPEEAADRLQAGEQAVIRFRVPEGATTFRDHIRGQVTFRNAEVDDWILVRTDGSPTYNFVVVCDDAQMRITHVVRGEEHLVNTPKQVLLYEALGLTPPEFAHLPLMLGDDGKKLSKRTGDTALEDYRDKGFPREAMINFLALQGWALDGETEVFGADELVKSFELGDVSKGGSIFDLDKLRWLAGEYVRRDEPGRLAEHCAPFVVRAGLMTEGEIAERRDWFLDVVRSERERFQVYSEFPARIAYLFACDDEVEYEEKAVENSKKHEGAADTLRAYAVWLRERLDQGRALLELGDGSKAWTKDRGLKIPALFQPLRCALSGKSGGPDLFAIMALLGAQSSLRRIEVGAGRLEG
jgi:glutamyl-tRNA synthetase